jgi:hypothetical protein
MLIFGLPFSGKSTMASQLAYFKNEKGEPFKILYLDAESGSIDEFLDKLQADGVDIGNIYNVYTQSLGEVRQYIAKVKNNEDFYVLDDEGNDTNEILLDSKGQPMRFDAIVVDGTSILNLTTKQGLVEFSKKRNRVKAEKDGLIGDAKLVKVEGSSLELKDYQTINFKGQDLILDLISAGVHAIVTARETDEKEQVKLEDGTTTSISTGKKIADGFKGMDYNVKTILHMFRDKDTNTVCCQVEKDRCGVYSDLQILEDPSLLDWQVVIDKSANRQQFVLKNDLTKAVEVEKGIYTKEIMGNFEDTTTENNKETLPDNKKEVDALKNTIVNTIGAKSPVEKAEVKKKLVNAGLPTAFKDVTDIEVLNKVMDIIKG